MIIRELNEVDIKKLQDVHRQNFPFPDLTDLMYFDKCVAEQDGEIVASVICKLTSEGILIVDEGQQTVRKMKAIMELIEHMKKSTFNKGMSECHVWCMNDTLKAILFKLGFKPCKGESMVTYYGKR